MKIDINMISNQFIGQLTLIFITLKLIGILKWSWWAVLAPIWLPIAIVMTIGFISYLVLK